MRLASARDRLHTTDTHAQTWKCIACRNPTCACLLSSLPSYVLASFSLRGLLLALSFSPLRATHPTLYVSAQGNTSTALLRQLRVSLVGQHIIKWGLLFTHTRTHTSPIACAALPIVGAAPKACGAIRRRARESESHTHQGREGGCARASSAIKGGSPPVRDGARQFGMAPVANRLSSPCPPDVRGGNGTDPAARSYGGQCIHCTLVTQPDRAHFIHRMMEAGCQSVNTAHRVERVEATSLLPAGRQGWLRLRGSSSRALRSADAGTEPQSCPTARL